jgi:hypothetical protein
MSIDKSPEGGRLGGPSQKIPFGQFLATVIAYLVFLTPFVALPLFIWAIELGVCVRVFKEAFDWGYDLLWFS